MAEEKLGAFKAGDLQKQKQSGTGKPVKPKKGAESAPEEESVSLGFLRIEEILDTTTREQTLARLEALTAALDALVDERSSGSKHKTAAEKAKLAIGHTRALLEYLFDTKDSLGSGGARK